MKYAGGHGRRGQLLQDEERTGGCWGLEDAEGVGWIGAKGMRHTKLVAGIEGAATRIISFNYSKMSGWITSYFFLELTFNGLSTLPATTDSFYILPLEA